MRYAALGRPTVRRVRVSVSWLALATWAIGFWMGQTASWLVADEGMWLFNNLPISRLSERYGFEPDQAWADHLRLASVRLNSGGSASLVSSRGLVLTNHHVAADTLYKLSTPENNYFQDGFLARSLEEELPAPDLEINRLISIEDVTDRVNSAVSGDMSSAEAAKARQAAMAEIEKASLEATGLRSDVVTLYGGARYHLYRYQRYTDVRLVWAPEAGAAFFGGDADNFEYPRYCLDVTLLRVYEDGQPAQIDHFLELEPAGVSEEELVLVSGHPGRTRRILTADALRYQRDVRLPDTLDYLRRREVLLQQYGFRGPEQKRQAQDDLFGVQNSRKAYTGMLAGLQDPGYVSRRAELEADWRRELTGQAGSRSVLEAFESVAQAQQQRRAVRGQTATLRSSLYGIAQTLVLMAAEDRLPSGDRLRPFRDSNRQSLEQQLFSPAPIYPELETLLVADELGRLAEQRGGEDALVLQLLAGRSPIDRAADVVAGTGLLAVDARRALAQGGLDAVEASDDPLIELARMLEPEYRRLDAINEAVEEQERQAYARIVEAQFARDGESTYPDATFTLRLAFGQVAGYELAGERIPAWTKLAGAFEREQLQGKVDPWVLPSSWQAAQPRLDLEVPINFVCTADIIGGNSGSPVVNRQGRLVGVIFDGNIQSLPADFYYSDEVARAVAVHVAGMLETLRTIYQADHLLEELGR